jgi:hypothetical protein
MQRQGGRETTGSRFPVSGGPGGRSSPGAVLTAEDRAVYEKLRPSQDIWSQWVCARRSTLDPASEYFGWPLHVTLVLLTWDAAAADVRATGAALDAALGRAKDARSRRARRARAYRAMLAEAGRTWATVSTAMVEYSEASERATAAAVALQRAELAHARALWWAEALMRSGLLGGAFVHMRVARRALECGASVDWHAEPPVELPPPPPAPPPPAPRPVPKKRGPLSVMRQTTGAWILVDARRPMGAGEIFKSLTLAECNAELDLRADAEGVPHDLP